MNASFKRVGSASGTLTILARNNYDRLTVICIPASTVPKCGE